MKEKRGSKRKAIIELAGPIKKARLQFWDERSSLVTEESKHLLLTEESKKNGH